ncbi:hypothetical protein CYMTET_54757 [Cymbomonas tetramitiformis]|uniref:Uncharacterized protein n=1 Tax=Cymbomonas tetramitiformis TaxID=36881 RepID=A0AAE0BE88_9CHLO|nr:hypothetical protein CYMTET_54757 [Cymbomonas tetramitiformis]
MDTVAGPGLGGPVAWVSEDEIGESRVVSEAVGGAVDYECKVIDGGIGAASYVVGGERWLPIMPGEAVYPRAQDVIAAAAGSGPTSFASLAANETCAAVAGMPLTPAGRVAAVAEWRSGSGAGAGKRGRTLHRWPCASRRRWHRLDDHVGMDLTRRSGVRGIYIMPVMRGNICLQSAAD